MLHLDISPRTPSGQRIMARGHRHVF
jgi:hypothetical protein